MERAGALAGSSTRGMLAPLGVAGVLAIKWWVGSSATFFFYLAMGRRETRLAEKRARHAKKIAKLLAKRLASHKQQTRIHGTNRLIQSGSLKKRALRELFGGWVKKYGRKEKRLFTKRLGQDVCNLLRERFGLGPTPDEEWRHLSACLALARKRGLKKYKSPTGKKMDNLETQPIGGEAVGLLIGLFW